jgi:ankyrin repeat protein
MNRFIRLTLLSIIPFIFSSCSNPKSEIEKMSIPFTEDGFVRSAEQGNLKAVELFLKAKMNIDAKDAKGWTALSCATMNGKTDIVHLLLEKGADLNQKQTSDTGEPMSLLNIASQKGFGPIIQELVTKGAKVDEKDSTGGTALFEAAAAGQTEAVKILLEKGTNPNIQDKHGATALMCAADQGHLDSVNLLLAKGADVNLQMEDTSTALMNAIKSGKKEILEAMLAKNPTPETLAIGLFEAILKKQTEMGKLLIEKNIDLNYQSKINHHWTPLLLAVDLGNDEIAKAMLNKGADPKIRADYDDTALHSAALRGRSDVVPLLIEKGADVNAKETKNGNTPLSLAASKGFTPIVKILLEHGADPNSVDQIGFSVLMIAAQDGKSEIANLLVQHKANVNALTTGGIRAGLSALMCAATRGHKDIVELLLKNGADPTLKDSAGALAWMYAEHNGHHDIAEELKNSSTSENQAVSISSSDQPKSVVEITETEVTEPVKPSLSVAISQGNLETVLQLLDVSHINSPDENGWTPIMYASSSGQDQIVKALIEKGADVKIADPKGWTPLMLASFKGNTNSLKYLLEKGADVNAKTPKNTTALMVAAGNGFIEVVQLLLASKADINQKDADGKTALAYAIQKNQTAVIDLLKKAGAQQ